MNSLPKNVTRQHRGCDLNPGPPAPESSTLTTRLLSHSLQLQQCRNASVVTDGRVMLRVTVDRRVVNWMHAHGDCIMTSTVASVVNKQSRPIGNVGGLL